MNIDKVWQWGGYVLTTILCLLVVGCIGMCIHDIPRENAEREAKTRYLREHCRVVSYVGSSVSPVPVYECPGQITTWHDLRLPRE